MVRVQFHFRGLVVWQRFELVVFVEQEVLELEVWALVSIACRVLVVVVGGAICCDSSFFPWIASPQRLGQDRSYVSTSQGCVKAV